MSDQPKCTLCGSPAAVYNWEGDNWRCYECYDREMGEWLDANPLEECEDCGEPATTWSADGVWLCDGDYERLQREWETVPDEDK